MTQKKAIIYVRVSTDKQTDRGNADYTGMISSALDGATTYGNQAAASSIFFALFSHFVGVVPLSWSTDPRNVAHLGIHTVTGRDPTTGAATTRTTTNIVHIANDGEMEEQSGGIIPIAKQF